ncbi:hypothetical protein LshimejAT787_0203550 [Lyophyllum shimeji]|uniref:Uncharacterized protein n=1 Tax=Lyophyllum shimeji TaxID=47721 RepID=A0A9P3PF18_LYOSH|nr:hypothetical protein LshimejAT787_0203550 [Lyophyllum shimeji]
MTSIHWGNGYTWDAKILSYGIFDIPKVSRASECCQVTNDVFVGSKASKNDAVSACLAEDCPGGRQNRQARTLREVMDVGSSSFRSKSQTRIGYIPNMDQQAFKSPVGIRAEANQASRSATPLPTLEDE